MGTLLSWKTVGWLLATFLIPAVVSAYGPEIRRMLDAWKRKPGRFALSHLQYKLALLENLHGSSYNLLLHFIWNLLWIAQFCVVYVLAIAVIGFLSRTSVADFSFIVLAAIIGRVLALRDTISGLYRYEQATTDLKAAIGELQKKFAGGADIVS